MFAAAALLVSMCSVNGEDEKKKMLHILEIVRELFSLHPLQVGSAKLSMEEPCCGADSVGNSNRPDCTSGGGVGG